MVEVFGSSIVVGVSIGVVMWEVDEMIVEFLCFVDEDMYCVKCV